MAAINLKQVLGEVADDINETLDELLRFFA